MSRKCQVQLLSNLWQTVRGDTSTMEDGSCCKLQQEDADDVCEPPGEAVEPGLVRMGAEWGRRGEGSDVKGHVS